MIDTPTTAPTIVTCNKNYTTTDSHDRYTVYKTHLSEYAAQTVAKVVARKNDQWALLSFLQPGVVLFTFYNHQRLCFSKQRDRIVYKFKTTPPGRKLHSFSFRVLWVVQSPLFTEHLQRLCPAIDKGRILLTFNEQTDSFTIRLSWASPCELPQGEVLVQTLLTWGDCSD